MKQSLNYFHRLWLKQQERRDNGDKNWEAQFLSAETWRNLRITCRGFFGYCRSIIDYASTHDNIKLYAVSPAHANSSIIEAWFSLVRRSGQDSGTSYGAIVKNVHMRDANKELKRNSMYSAEDVGDIEAVEHLDLLELSRHQKQRRKEKDERLSAYKEVRRTTSIASSNAFSISVEEAQIANANESELDVLKVLVKKRLPRGYMDELLKEDVFHQWLQLSIGSETDAWFKELLDVTQSVVGSAAFDEACRTILNKLLCYTAEIMRKRKSRTVSFEARVHKFFKSAEFDEICKENLPGNLGNSCPGCVLLGLMLSQLHQDWLRLALKHIWEHRHPELFKQKQGSSLTAADENNEVNSFVGWSIFSALKKKKYRDANEEENDSKRLLLSMVMSEEDADDEYLAKYYDTNMSMINCGGLTLVRSTFFDWGKDAMEVIRNAFTQDHMKRNLRNSFRDGKCTVMQDARIRSEFILLCRRSSSKPFEEEAIKEVYNVILRKMIHARFAVVLRQWKEDNCQKHDMSLRSTLKASVAKKKRKQPKTEESTHPDGSAIDNKKARTS